MHDEPEQPNGKVSWPFVFGMVALVFMAFAATAVNCTFDDIAGGRCVVRHAK